MPIEHNGREYCRGCTACKAICPSQAIQMKPDREGFLYPDVNLETCVDCGLCEEVCHEVHRKVSGAEQLKVYAAKHCSNTVRASSTSGGVFTAVSDMILSRGGVVFGATYDSNLRVIHQVAKTSQERDGMKGSKYVQSDLLESLTMLKNELESGREVLFTGTSCQVAGVLGYLSKLRIKTDKLLTVDMICHGTPSPKVFHDFICYLEQRRGVKVTQYFFRSKVNGWGHTEEAVFSDGRRDHTSILSQAFRELFYMDICLRPSCHICPYASLIRPADITFGDYWGIESIRSGFSDSLGVSALVINTQKGKEAFSGFQHHLLIEATRLEDCAAKQHNMRAPTPPHPRRHEFWSDYAVNGFEYILEKYVGYGFERELKQCLRRACHSLGVLKAIRALKSPFRRD